MTCCGRLAALTRALIDERVASLEAGFIFLDSSESVEVTADEKQRQALDQAI